MKQRKLLSFFRPHPRPVIITIHGYGRRRSHEMDNIAAWAEKENFDIIQFDLYDLFDEKDCDPKQWLSRARKQVDIYIAQKRPIYLLGFSMGGVIASYLASLYPVEKLVLVCAGFHLSGYVQNSRLCKERNAFALSFRRQRKRCSCTKELLSCICRDHPQLP